MAESSLDLGLLRNLEGIVHLYSEIPDRALQLRVPQEELDCTDVLGSLVDQRAFVRRSECVPYRL